jgi:hypothetical protein
MQKRKLGNSSLEVSAALAWLLAQKPWIVPRKPGERTGL